MVKEITLALFVSAFLLLIIPILLFPSYSQTNVNNTNSLDQGNVSLTGEGPSVDNTSRMHYVFKFKWGSFGTGNDQFRRPHDVAFDSKGFVYVTDRDNNNVQKFTHNGTFVKAWGSTGSADGQFKIPYSIGIDPRDNIYVVDRENHRIQKFDSDGKFIAKWGNGRGSADNQFKRPEDITFTPNAIYVTDTGNNRVMKFNKNFTLITKWGTKGTGEHNFEVKSWR